MAIGSHTAVSSTLGADVLDKLQGRLRGELLRPGLPGYDAARAIFNAMIDKHPALIVRCQAVSDVQHALEFARRYNLLVAVRGGGHNVGGNAACDDGLVIDLSPMKGVDVDPPRRIVHAEPASPGASSTGRPRRTVWRPPAASFQRPVSPA